MRDIKIIAELGLLLIFSVFNSLQAQEPADTAGAGQAEWLKNYLVVTGQFQPQSLRNSVYNVKVIDQERIKMRGATDITGVLNNELGIRFTTDNLLGETDTKIQGMGGSRVKILLDGLPLADRDATKQSITQVDMNSVERIEIIEGPLSVMYGTDALAGVINIITKKDLKKGENLSVTARIQEETAGNTYNPFMDDGIHNENIGINWNNNKWRAAASVTRNDFGGFTASEAFPSKLFKPKKQWFGGGMFGYKSSRVNAWYRLNYLNEELLVASPMSLTTGKGSVQHYITNRYTHQAQADWTVNGKLRINSALSFQDYKRNTETYTKNYTDGTVTANKSDNDIKAGFWDITPFRSWFVRSTAAWTLSSRVALQPGIDIKYDKSSGQRIKGNPSISDVSFFASADLKLVSDLTIRPGVRFTKNSTYDAPPVIPSLNVKLALNKEFDLRASYAHGFRAPLLRELYFYFFDSNHSIAGNPDLKAENSDSYNASLTWHNNKTQGALVTSSLSAFYNDYHDFIDLYNFTDENNNLITSYFNRDKNKTIGATFDNTINWRKLIINAGISYVGYYNKYQEDKGNTGNRSIFTFTPEATANFSYNLSKLNAGIGLYYKYTGKIPSYRMDNDKIVLTKRDAFHWADLTITKQFPRYIGLQGGIKNIFDVTDLQASGAAASGGAHSTGSTTNYAYGRSYFLGINFQWAHSTKK